MLIEVIYIYIEMIREVLKAHNEKKIKIINNYSELNELVDNFKTYNAKKLAFC